MSKKILAIDDSRMVHMVVTKTLKPLDVEVITAISGQEGIEKAETERPEHPARRDHAGDGWHRGAGGLEGQRADERYSSGDAQRGFRAGLRGARQTTGSVAVHHEALHW